MLIWLHVFDSGNLDERVTDRVLYDILIQAGRVVDLPFPDNMVDIPAGIESTDKLPSLALFYKFALATQHMQPHFERVLETLPRVSFMVSDGFLWWTVESASKFKIPRLGFTGVSNYCNAFCKEAHISGILSGPQPDDELVTLNRFPQVRICKNDFESVFTKPDALQFDFFCKVAYSNFQ